MTMYTINTECVNGIRRVSEHVYDIYIRPEKRREYRRNGSSFQRPGVFNLDNSRWYKGGKVTTRDTQRERAYKAENEVRRLIEQRTYATVREAATFFRNIMESDWFQRRFPNFFYLRIEYEPGSRAAHACPTQWDTKRIGEHLVTRGWIGFSSWAMGNYKDFGGELIMLHELAHAILPKDQWHGRRWARTFVELTTHFMGKDVGGKLKAAYKARKVKMNPYPVISDERRRAMAGRLAEIRLLRKSTGFQAAATLE